MNLPSNMLPELGRENWKARSEISIEPSLRPAADDGIVAFDPVSGDSSRISWPMKEYEEDSRNHKIYGWLYLALIAIFLLASMDKTSSATIVFLPLIFTNPSAFLLLMLYIGPFLFFGITELLRAYSAQWRGQIILDSDRVIVYPGLKRPRKSLFYEQICRIGLDRKERQVIIRYYPIEESGNLNTSRLQRLAVPHTKHDEEIHSELLRRAFGPTISAPVSRVFYIVALAKVILVLILMLIVNTFAKII
jgi:hypothetical protein